MEGSAEEAVVVEPTSGGATPSSRVRRRLIQSTLFPHKSPDVVTEDEDCKQREDHAEVEEECFGSQSSKRRKPKALAQPRTSKKAAVIVEEALGTKPDEGDSPLTVKSEFFSKVSVKRQRKRQQKEQLCISSPEETDKICSPQEVVANTKSPPELNVQANMTPEKLQANATPKKRRASLTPKKQQASLTPKKRQRTPKKSLMNSSSLNEACLGQMSCENTPVQIPNLRLEAKMRAEENSRIFSGKQIHPFFSFWKTGKKNQDASDMDSKCCSTGRNKNTNFTPIHVFEKVQDDSFSPDWGNWIFLEMDSVTTNFELQRGCSPIYEGSVKSLKFENCQNKGSSDHCPIHVEEDHNVYKVKSFSEQAGCEKNPNVERTMSYYRRCINMPQNSLWTNKYQPEKAIEICGNRLSVEFISEWLRLWHAKVFRTNKNCSNGVEQPERDVDYSYYSSDCDSGDIGEEDSLKNVLLVTGPVGSGKSAAIYACAKECGFQVIEVNASDWRNGALVKQKFGEAVESHWHQCAADTPDNFDNKQILKSSPCDHNQVSNDEVIEVIQLRDEDAQTAYRINGKSECKENGTPTDQTVIKTLILFEDVDATLYEDRGFTSTIQQLAETAKRPMILTSNSKNPVLPNNLAKLEVSFNMPSKEELFDLVYMVCVAEEAKLQPCLVEHFIAHCQGDIRKTIMNLQFWCQGQSYIQDNQMKKICGQVAFDLDAAHRMLPKIIPFVFPSLLAEIIEKEVSKSITMLNDNPSLTTIVEEPDINIEAKKEAMLKQHSPDHDENHFTARFSDSMDSPIAFTRRNIRSHKSDAVVFSDSEEEFRQFYDMNNEVKFEADAAHCVETADLLNMHGSDSLMQQSFDISCVPDSIVQQSSFVPETEIDNGSTFFADTISCAHVDNDSRIQQSSFVSKSLQVEAVPHQPQEIFCNGDVNTGSAQGEGVGDSLVEHVESVTREYHLMDECSQMDFRSGPSVFIEKPGSSVAVDFVQETWRKFRDSDTVLRQYATLEQEDTCQVLELAHGMSNLISEVDLLLSDCQEVICDSLEPSMVPCEKSHSYSCFEDQFLMTSTMAEHGMCLYTKELSAIRSNIDSTSSVDLAREMLTSSTNTAAFGKLVSQEKRMISSSVTNLSESSYLLRRERESRFCDLVQSIVPPKLYLASKGNAFHEYLSSLSSISRSESSRLSQGTDKSKRRRVRVARNYLTTGALDLSPEEILLLDQRNFHLSNQSINCNGTID